MVGKIAVTHNGLRSSHGFYGFQDGKGLRIVSVAVQMEVEDKAGLAVENEPEVIFFAMYFDYGFIGVPLVRVGIERWNELYGNVLGHRGEVRTPVADGSVRYADIYHGT